MNFECDNYVLTEERKEEIDSKFAKFFFRTGISLRVADSEALKDLMESVNPAYAKKMPSAKSLSGSLLDKQYEKCLKVLEKILEEAENLTLISDGWTNIRRDHIVNFCVKSHDAKPFFYTSIDTSGILQNYQAVADAIIEVIEQLGSEKSNCLITDNAPVMRKAWEIIETKYPHISANWCAAHGFNLLLKDIVDTAEFSVTIKEAEKIKYFTNHHIVKAKYEEKRKIAKVGHTLSMSVITRWFSLYRSMNDLLASKYVLIQVVDENIDILKDILPKPTSAAVIKLIKTDEFWENLTGM